MAHINRLTAKFVENAKPKKKGRTKERFLDGGGLYLNVTVSPDGKRFNRSWVFKFELCGRRAEVGMGPTHTVTLVEAREQAREYRKMLIQGIDPLAAKKAQARAEELRLGSQFTFKQDAEAYIELHRPEWRSAVHAKQWESSLQKYVYPRLGSTPTSEITTPMIRDIIDPIWNAKTETASRILQRIETVLAYSKSKGHRTGDNPASDIRAALPKKSKVYKKQSFESVPYEQVGDVMAMLATMNSLQAKALRFVVLTAARAGEVTGATWSEIDLKGKLWTIPPERMKADRVHDIPLSESAIGILQSLPRNGERVFQSDGRFSRLMRYALQTLPGLKDATVHGFRSSFSTWANKRTNFPRKVIESALAHKVAENGTEAAYNKAKHLEERRKLLRAWAAFCALPSAPTTGEVVPLRAAKKAKA
jgi:integrase